MGSHRHLTWGRLSPSAIRLSEAFAGVEDLLVPRRQTWGGEEARKQTRRRGAAVGMCRSGKAPALYGVEISDSAVPRSVPLRARPAFRVDRTLVDIGSSPGGVSRRRVYARVLREKLSRD